MLYVIVLDEGSHVSKKTRIRPKSQFDKLILQFKPINFAIQTDIICDSKKYSHQFKQMQLV